MSYKDDCKPAHSGVDTGEDFIKFNDVFVGGIHKSVRGTVDTAHGIARVHSTYHEGRYQSSCVEIMKDGRLHYRRFDEAFGERGLIREARNFAEELFNV